MRDERLAYLDQLFAQRETDAIAVLELIERAINRKTKLVRIKLLRQLVRKHFEFTKKYCPMGKHWVSTSEMYSCSWWGNMSGCRHCRKLKRVNETDAERERRVRLHRQARRRRRAKQAKASKASTARNGVIDGIASQAVGYKGRKAKEGPAAKPDPQPKQKR